MNTPSAFRLRFSVFFVLLAVAAVGGQPSTAWMKQTLTSHFSEPRHHLTNLQYKIAAKEFIKQQFENLGLVTVIQSFATAQRNVRGENVIGILKGVNYDTANDSIIAISAHYDTMRGTPGVNDNGAGVVVMLEAARTLAKHKPRQATVLFISFDFEEWERADDAACTNQSTLCGSRSLVRDWLTSYFKHWSSLKWLGLANMDTVLNFDDRDNTQNLPPGYEQAFQEVADSVKSDNYEGDFLTVAGRTPQDLTILRDFHASWVSQGSPGFEVEMVSIPANVLPMVSDLTRSDHANFWNAGLSAVFLTDTADFRSYMETCYHSQCDNITYATEERLRFAVKISEALISWVDGAAPATSSAATVLPWSFLLSVLVATFVITETSPWNLRQKMP